MSNSITPNLDKLTKHQRMMLKAEIQTRIQQDTNWCIRAIAAIQKAQQAEGERAERDEDSANLDIGWHINDAAIMLLVYKSIEPVLNQFDESGKLPVDTKLPGWIINPAIARELREKIFAALDRALDQLAEFAIINNGTNNKQAG